MAIASAALLVAATFSLGAFRPARADLIGGHIANLPTQFIAKLYTEGLGRAPDQQGWANEVAAFDTMGCNVPALQAVGKSVLEGPELMNQWGRDPYALTEIAFRALLNREPDPHGFSVLFTFLRSHTWDQTLTHVFQSPEFGSLSTQICSRTSPSYGFNGSNGQFPAGVAGPIAACTTCIPITVPPGAILPSEAQLRLLAAMPGETIELAPRSVIVLTQPLTLAPGVTLETFGQPGPTSYINMARLVRGWNTNAPGLENGTVVLDGGAVLQNVWISGQRALWRDTVIQSMDPHGRAYLNTAGQVLRGEDVRTLGGFWTTVQHNRIDDSPGWSSLEVNGSDTGSGCATNTIVGNLIEAYSSVHTANVAQDQIMPWTDGISDHCQSSTVNLNQIVDASDVPLILFETVDNTWGPGPPQISQVGGNTIVSAGNSAYSALAADPGLNTTGPGDPDGSPGSQDFTGSVIGGRTPLAPGARPTGAGQGNLLWSGPRTHFNAVISDGTMDFFGSGNAYMGKGATFLNNTTGMLGANAGAGIVVSGMQSTTVQGNTFNINLIPVHRGYIWGCPGAQHQVEWDYPLRASGSVQGDPAAVQIPPPSVVACIVPGS